jgi:hypothetical protein
VGCLFDEAANIKEVCNGWQAHLKNNVNYVSLPTENVLNLVIVDSTECN